MNAQVSLGSQPQYRPQALSAQMAPAMTAKVQSGGPQTAGRRAPGSSAPAGGGGQGAAGGGGGGPGGEAEGGGAVGAPVQRHRVRQPGEERARGLGAACVGAQPQQVEDAGDPADE